MRRIVLTAAVAVALGLAAVIAPGLVRFGGEDICLDNGGRVLRATRQCELAPGHTVPLYGRPGHVRFWAWIAFGSLAPGGLLVWVAHRATRPRPAAGGSAADDVAAGAG